MTELNFREWPKTARLNRDMIVTEKIDGTNAAVIVHVLPSNWTQAGDGERFEDGTVVNLAGPDGWSPVLVAAQSRKKLITPEKDNFGFARFVHDHAEAFAHTLGEGIHFGEWYGSGIQRGYTTGPQREKRFMLFNTTRWGDVETRQLLLGRFDGRVEVATVLEEGPFDTLLANRCVERLRNMGSFHVPGFDNPEGVVVHHVQANINFKVTVDRDDAPKGVANA